MRMSPHRALIPLFWLSVVSVSSFFVTAPAVVGFERTMREGYHRTGEPSYALLSLFAASLRPVVGGGYLGGLIIIVICGPLAHEFGRLFWGRAAAALAPSARLPYRLPPTPSPACLRYVRSPALLERAIGFGIRILSAFVRRWPSRLLFLRRSLLAGITCGLAILFAAFAFVSVLFTDLWTLAVVSARAGSRFLLRLFSGRPDGCRPANFFLGG